ncbi:MAG: hypothetical protein IKP22_04555 [Clostridia bacterium]|nr:hypothetical protein [Clostridia bacterium]
MKKIVSLLMIFCLLLACAPAMANVNEWAPAIPSDYTLTYDYFLTIPQITDHKYNPTWKMITRYEHYKELGDTWKVAHFMVAGFDMGSDRYTVVPVPLTRDVTLVYPVVTTTLQIVGVMWATVRGGTLRLNMALRDAGGNVFYKENPSFTVFTTQAQAKAQQGIRVMPYQGIDIEGELGGAQSVLVNLDGMVSYNLDIRKAKIFDKDLNAYVEVTYTFTDYWKNSPEWVAYRNGLQPIMNEVPTR